MRGVKPQATGDEVEAMIQLLHWAQDPVHIDTLLDVRDLVQNRQLGNAKRAAYDILKTWDKPFTRYCELRHLVSHPIKQKQRMKYYNDWVKLCAEVELPRLADCLIVSLNRLQLDKIAKEIAKPYDTAFFDVAHQANITIEESIDEDGQPIYTPRE